MNIKQKLACAFVATAFGQHKEKIKHLGVKARFDAMLEHRIEALITLHSIRRSKLGFVRN
ncbi:hypothetical protein EI969_07510 [Pseudomonas sp. PB101]|uniref:hypothetical protein n=1 Tax=Pseudomonas sp. PB101 TaxID=2495428 RepID=UPI001365EAE4|nr:hypothetical protein [Pseudomonas sp. PB101]MVW85787.1 hypothetical protein [Pseudomonas sp. PB101]